jgi:protein-L-isoaspartate O-methyltransferase
MTTATYCAGDNRIRLYPSARLDRETYDRVRAAGFAWAPKQELFVAPRWTPAAEDIAIELAGDIDDEDMAPAERAAARAERFEGYQGKRAAEAHQARAAVAGIADVIPLAQPILVGHHSEKRARKDAERIENGMRRAVKLWDTSTYWASRAQGSIAHARYVELPAVRARRIKKLEAEKRGHERDLATSEKYAALWRGLDDQDSVKRKDGATTTFAERVTFAARTGAGCKWDLESRLAKGEITPEAAQASVIAGHQSSAENEKRWIAHLENRLTYERAMLGESGYVPPPKKASKAELPILNYSGTVTYRTRYSKEIATCAAAPLTKAEFARINKDYKGTVISACGTHRLRTAMLKGHTYGIVYLTDSKQHPRPDAKTVAEQAEKDEVARDLLLASKDDEMRARVEASAKRAPEREKAAREAAPFDQLKKAVRDGVHVVVAPQLFPTPPALAARMVELAGIEAGDRVLEPSAGTGNILKAIAEAEEMWRAFNADVEVTAIEIDYRLAEAIPAHLADEVITGDFLLLGPSSRAQFERVVMNPPFSKGTDCAHVKHALEFLKPGGRLVAICANGPRQQAELRPLATTWEELPDGTFAEAGTNVRTVLLTIQR